MSKILAGVDQRTQLAGHNRMELLLFQLAGDQLFGINVFKVKEITQCPSLSVMPHSHPAVKGAAHMRGVTMPIFDLALAIGLPPIPDYKNKYVITTEYNGQVQGLLVEGVDRIINTTWKEIQPPPKGTGNENYLTAVTRYNEKIIEIIDVERVMDEIQQISKEIAPELTEHTNENIEKQHILVVDDSSVARNQIKRVLDQVGVESTLAKNGAEAYQILEEWADAEGDALKKRIALVISDIEMPQLDGYALTTAIRKHPILKDLYVVLHTSLSGVFNKEMVKSVGADKFIAKFSPDILATAIIEQLDSHAGQML